MKRALSLLLLSACVTAPLRASAQSIRVEWTEPRAIAISDTPRTLPHFNGACYRDGLPWYGMSPDAPAQSAVSLSDITYAACTPAESDLLNGIPLDSVPRVVTSVTTERKEERLNVEILPLVFRKGQYWRMESATLSATPAPGLRAARAGAVQSYASHSALASGRWVKISVASTGVHLLTAETLRGMGFSDPSKVHVYGYGGAVLNENFSTLLPRADDLTELPVYNDGNRVLFYATAARTETFQSITTYRGGYCWWDFTTNPYSDKGYYFLTENDRAPLAMPLQAPPEGTPNVEINRNMQVAYKEDEKVNLLESGRMWLGDELNATTTSRSATFRFNHPVEGGSVYAFIRTVGACNETGGSRIMVDFNGERNETALYMPAITGDFAGQISNMNQPLYYPMPASGVIEMTLNYTPPNAAAKAWLDRATLTGECYLTMYGDETVIRYPAYQYVSSDIARYTLSEADSGVEVWDITDPASPSRMELQADGSSVTFTAPYDKTRVYVAVRVDGTGFPTPAFAGNVANQDLHSLDGLDLVILSAENLLTASERLAAHHRSFDGLRVAVVTPEQVYNEFSSGTPDITAYRLLMKMLYDRRDNGTPPALLLMGTASYDNRGILGSKAGLLCYQSENSIDANNSYTTDDYLGMLDDTEGGSLAKDKMDIAVGRVPVSTLADANAYVDKVIGYATGESLGAWRNRVVFMGDDGDGNLHATQAEGLAETLFANYPAYEPRRIFLDAYTLQQSATGGSYPGAREKLLSELKSGCLIFTYIGHSSQNTITHEQVFTLSDAPELYCQHPAFWISASCDLACYDNGKRSIASELIRNPNGALALISAMRVVYSYNNFQFATNLYKYLVPADGEEGYTIGEIMRLAKNAFVSPDLNKLNFNLLGDPMIRLRYPRQTVVTDSVNGTPPSDAVMRALGLVTLKGHVDDGEGGVDSGFNGQVQITVYDKEETLQTLNNRDDGPLIYTDYPSVLFSGRANVTDGTFTTTFMVPKDISYRYDKGRVLYYATDPERDTDAHGYEHGVTVGGSDPDARTATEGPSVRMYLNTPSFKDGQTVDNTPVFFAHTYDSCGVNAIGSGIGHDITLRLNNSKTLSYILNDYYESTLNDYRSGRVVYEIPQLSEGDYTLTFKIWNLQNISTTETLRFTVSDEAEPSIERFFIYPNPTSGPVTIEYRHDRPMEWMEATFTLYDLSGRVCREETVSGVSDDGSVSVSWNLLDGAEGGLCSGIYPIMLKLTTKEGTFTTKPEKIVLVTP